MDDRQRWRGRLGIADQDFVLVHSGGLGLYQHPHAMIGALDQLLKNRISAKLLLATRKIEMAREYMAQQPELVQRRTLVQKFPAGLHRHILAVGDAGLVLREPNATNKVAFPNKVDEYWAVGLPTITTPALRAVANLIEGNPVLGIVARGPKGQLTTDGLEAITEIQNGGAEGRESRFHAIRAARLQISFEVTLQPFLAYLIRAREARNGNV